MLMSQEIWTALGGLGLFLLGMGVMADGLRQLGDASLGRWLSRSTRSPLSGAITGAIATAAVQSSSATTVAAVGFVSAGILTFEQALGVLFGANVGTTATGWMVALVGFKLDIGAIAPIVVLAGALMRLAGQGRLRALGGALAGFGLVFTGIDILQQGMADLGASVTPSDFPSDTALGRIQLAGIGLIITLITQSSSAGVATALAAIHAGTLSFPQAAAMVIGMDVGTTFTAIVAVLGGDARTRRTGYAHVIYNLLTAIGAMLLLTPFSAGLESLWPGSLASEPELALVGFHTCFNALGLLAVLPFTRRFADWMIRIVPEEHEGTDELLSERLLGTPAVALESAAAATRRLTSSTLRFVSRDLRRPMAADSRRSGLQRLHEQANRIRSYLEEIVTPRSAARPHEAHVALLDAVDHLRRLMEHMETRHTQARKLRRGPSVEALVAELARNVGRRLLATSIEMRDLGSGADIEGLFSLWRRLDDGSAELRDTILAAAASDELDGERAMDCLDDARRIQRVAFHTYRTAEHLRDAGKRFEAATPSSS